MFENIGIYRIGQKITFHICLNSYQYDIEAFIADMDPDFVFSRPKSLTYTIILH